MLDGFQHLLLVTRHGTFTEAAKHAHLSQPALSASIARLEEDLGARLFDRGRHGATLTEAGRALLPRAEAALAAVEDGRRAVAEVMGLSTGEVRVGGGATACTFLLPAPLARFRAAHPGVRIHLREGFTHALEDAVASGDLDLAIVTGEGDEPWREDELILVAAPDATHDDHVYVSFPDGSPTRALLLEHYPEADIVMELSSIAAVIRHVQAGIGRALVSRAAVQDAIARGGVVEVECRIAPIIRQLSFIHRGVERLPPAAGALREMLLDLPSV